MDFSTHSGASKGADFQACLAYIGCQTGARHLQEVWDRMAVTISRQTGSGAHPIAEKLAEYLAAHGMATRCPWAIFDKNLMARVLEEHHLPARLAQYLPEDRAAAIIDMIEEALGLHPDTRIVVRQSAETILGLAELGNVILIGRGANVITSAMPNVFHVRLVGSLEHRVARVQESNRVGRQQALALVHDTDRGRERYLKEYFGKAIDDPLLYDLILNTDRFPENDAVRVLGEAILERRLTLKRKLESEMAPAL